MCNLCFWGHWIHLTPSDHLFDITPKTNMVDSVSKFHRICLKLATRVFPGSQITIPVSVFLYLKCRTLLWKIHWIEQLRCFPLLFENSKWRIKYGVHFFLIHQFRLELVIWGFSGSRIMNPVSVFQYSKWRIPVIRSHELRIGIQYGGFFFLIRWTKIYWQIRGLSHYFSKTQNGESNMADTFQK